MLMLLGAVISLSFQKFASTAPFSLNSLRFVNAASALKIDWNLPLHLLIPLSLFVLFSLVPAAIWSGALTPNVVSKNITIPYTIPAIGTVDFSDNTLFQAKDGELANCPWITGDLANDEKIGNFHSCYDKLSLLNSAATSSTINPIPGHEEDKGLVHTKLDRSGYSFVGRSYGTGGSVGFSNIADVIAPLSHSFVEPGLYANVTCIRNETAAFHLKKQHADNGLAMWDAIGNATLPEGLDMEVGKFGLEFLVVGYLDHDLLTWASAYNNASTSYISLAACPNDCGEGNWTACGTYGFAQLHKTQCRIDFSAKNFELEVNNVARTIAVTPGETVDWPNYADTVLTQLAAEHTYISYNDGAFGGSTLGKAIRSNVDLLRAYRNETNATTDTMLAGVESFVADLVDNSLLSFSQSRYFGDGKEQKNITANLARNVAVYGEAKFIYAAVVLNALIVVIYVVEAVRSRFWARLTDLDLLDMASVAVGASLGGMKLAAHVQTLGMTSALLPGQRLAARDDAGEVKIRVTHTDGFMSKIEPADQRDGYVASEGDELTLLGKQKYKPVADEDVVYRPDLSYDAARNNSYMGAAQSPYSHI
jgi:hypothetical protein